MAAAQLTIVSIKSVDTPSSVVDYGRQVDFIANT